MKIVKPDVGLWAPFNNMAPMEHIERCARLCYKSEGLIKEGSAEKLLTRLMGVRHFSIIEHYRFIVEIPSEVYADLLIFHPRYLILSDYHKRNLVSGSARGFLELLEYVDWVAHDVKPSDEVGTLERVYAPTLYWELLGIIDAIVKEYHCPTLFSGYASFVKPWDGISIIHQEGLTGEELIKHGWFTAHIICDRGISHEWVRHRDASPSQESTRYCVAGDMVLTTKNQHYPGLTVEELYQKSLLDGNGAWKRIGIRQYDEDSKTLEFKTAKNIVFNGIKDCYCLKTQLGYTLVCTKDHRILTGDGYKELGDLAVGDKVAICASCQGRVHSKNLLTAYLDTIVSIEFVGEKKVFDIEMDSDSHNFVANGVVVHNCNYAGDKFGNEISVVQPVDVETPDQTRIWSNGIKSDELTYFDLLDAGAKPQTARANLPTCLKTELAFTATHEEWRHLLGLRCGKEAHPDARVIALKALKLAHRNVAEVYEDLWAQWGNEVADRGL